MASTTTIGVRLDDDTRSRLKVLGKVRQRSAHFLMKEAIKRYIDIEEQVEQERVEDMERWKHYRATGEHVSNEAMMDYLDSWGNDREKACPKP